jgi:leucyl/phenylalanyl-tRNA--protein transferase
MRFPDPRDAYQGVVAVGGNLHPANLLRAYRAGIFPWPIENLPLIWYCPQERAILEFKDVHIPRSLRKAARKSNLKFTIDRAFAEVIAACAHVTRKGEDGTWITPEMIRAYCRLYNLGHAHSVEAWDGERLVGGLYGIAVDGAFSGESMFHLQPNASKLALLHLIKHLRARGLEWMDIQVMTPHMQALGAKLISRDEFLNRLRKTRALRQELF